MNEPATDVYYPDNSELDIKTQEVRELLLGDKIIKKRESLKPGKDSEVFASLGQIICNMKWQISCERNSWKRSAELRKQLVETLTCLNNAIPPLYAEVDEALQNFATDGLIQPREEAISALSALEELMSAAGRASQQRILTAPELRIPPVDSWPRYAEVLEQKFHSLLPDQSKEAAYRFIVEVLPWVTGEEPTVDAVEKHLKRFHKGQ
jgi:hypothetical protein